MSTYAKLDGRRWALALICCACIGGHAFAQPAITLTNDVFQETEVRTEDGAVIKRLVPAVRVLPGEEVVYEIGYSNNGEQVATNVTIDNPLPEHLELIGETETPATVVSVDGGRTYGKLESLFVLGEDGEPRPARIADVTHLRWVIAELAPGATGKVSYRARVK